MPGIQNVTSSITRNTSNSSVVCELYPEPRESFCFRVIASFCIILMSLIGNALVCRGAIRRIKRPFSYYLVTNLAVAELVFTATQPFTLVYNTKPYSWIFGDFMCHVVDSLALCTTLVITFTLAAIAVYRCIMMIQPYRYRGFSTRLLYAVIAVSWIWGIALSLPDSVSRKRVQYEDCNVFVCESSVDLSDYRMTIFILNFVVPFITMLLSYSCVICMVRKHIVKSRQQIELYSAATESLGTRSSILSNDTKHQPQTRDKKLNKTTQDEFPVPILSSSPDSHQQKPPSNKMMRLEADVLNMIYLIILLFFLCYLPSNVLFILTEGLGFESIKHWKHYWLITWYLNLLHTAPTALHPICYGAKSKILGLFCRCPCRRRWFRK